MAERLEKLGFEVDPEPIRARKAAGKPVGRPHLAAAVLAHPANAERLAEEGHADVSSFIPAYLIQGKPGYVARTHPTVEEAIGWIHDAAGVAIWAHPFWDIKEADQVLAAIDRYRAAGLDGVEVFYTAHTEEQTSVGRRALRGARDADHGVRRLPRSRPPALQPLSGLRAPRARAEPRPDPAQHPRRAHARRRWPLRLADRPVGVRQVDHRTARGGRAARSRLPRRGPRRRRRAPEPVRRPRLLARGPRHQRAPHRMGVQPAVPKRRRDLRGRRLALPSGARPGARDDGRALRRGLRARLGRRMRAPRRQGPLREGPKRRDQRIHRCLRPLRGATGARAPTGHRGGDGAGVGREADRARGGAAAAASRRSARPSRTAGLPTLNHPPKGVRPL